MLYVLQRYHIESHIGEIMFDLWNYKFEMGYEIKITINKHYVNICKVV